MSALIPLTEAHIPGFPYLISETIEFDRLSHFHPANSVQSFSKMREMNKIFMGEIEHASQQEAFLRAFHDYQNKGIRLFPMSAYKLHVSLERTADNFNQLIRIIESVSKKNQFEHLEFKYKLLNLQTDLASRLRHGAELTIYIPANTLFKSSQAAYQSWTEFITTVTQYATQDGVKPHPEGLTDTDLPINTYFSYRMGNNGADQDLAGKALLLDPAGHTMVRYHADQATWVKASYYEACQPGQYNPLKLDDPFYRVLFENTIVSRPYRVTHSTATQPEPAEMSQETENKLTCI